MKIVLLCEGKTERAFGDAFKRFVDAYCESKGLSRVALQTKPSNGPVTNRNELVRRLRNEARNSDVVGVIALTDVYPEFTDAAAARATLKSHVAESPNKEAFHAHAAQYDVEAWLLPFWENIKRRLRIKKDAKSPWPNPEQVNGSKPPSRRLDELYKKSIKVGYDKHIEAPKILRDARIEDAAAACPELRSLLETLKSLCEKGRS